MLIYIIQKSCKLLCWHLNCSSRPSRWVRQQHLDRRHLAGRAESREGEGSSRPSCRCFLHNQFDNGTDPKPNHIQMTDRNWDVNQTLDAGVRSQVPWADWCICLHKWKRGNNYMAKLNNSKIERKTVGRSKPGAPLCSNWCGGWAVWVDCEYIKVPATKIQLILGLDSIICGLWICATIKICLNATLTG